VGQEKPDCSFNFYVYDLAAKKKVKDLHGQLEEREYLPSHACISADGKWLATLGNPVRLWDVTAGKQVWSRKGSGQPIDVLGFTPDGKHLVLCGGKDGSILVVDTAGARIVRTIATSHNDRRRGTLLSPDGKSVLMRLAGSSETVVWDLSSGKQAAPLEDPGKKLEAWAFSPDSKSFLFAEASSNETRVVVRDWPSRKVRRRFDLGRSSLSSLFVSADNRTVNVLFAPEQTLHRYDLETGKQLPAPGETHRGGVVGVEVAPDGSIVSLGADKVLRTWDLATHRQTRQVSLSFTPARAPFALSRDGKLIALANDSHSAVLIIDRDGKQIRRIAAAKGIDRVVFSPSGRFLAGREANIARVWETATGKTVAAFPASKGVWWSPAASIAFSPDERYFVATVAAKVQFQETDGWRWVEALPEHVSGMAFSPDGRMLACGSGRETTIWEVATRKARVKLGPEADWSGLQRFSPDGRLLARLTSAASIEVWAPLRGQRVATFQGHDGCIGAFTFTKDGRHLITASDDCTLLAWDVTAAVAAAQAGQKGPAATEKELTRCWKDLASADAQKAFTAIRILTNAPDRAIDLARAGLTIPAAPPDAARVRQLLTDLDSETFAVRARAERELQALGEVVETPIRRFLARKPPLEPRKRAERLLEAILRARTSPERLQQRRAVEVLENIGDKGACEVLRRLAKGPLEADLTRDAAAALRRIARR
jgi:WD40 repeat protein